MAAPWWFGYAVWAWLFLTASVACLRIHRRAGGRGFAALAGLNAAMVAVTAAAFGLRLAGW